MRSSILLLSLIVLTAPSRAEVTRHVPSAYPTIQAAIDAANFGDTVEIADGTYTGPGNRDLRLYGKAITVRSASGDPSACVIDCDESGRGFELTFQESPASVIEGLTITNGQVAGLGGAILCSDLSGATIRNCVLSANSAVSRGFLPGKGGALCVAQGSTVTLENCTLTGNTATGGINASVGGGIACFGSSVELVDCTIAGNTAGAGPSGGGIHARAGTLRLTRCVIDGNTAEGEGSAGGGVSVAEASLLIARDCTFSGNRADFGGAVAGDRSDAAFWNTAIVGNEATFSAGGVSWGEAMELSFTDCTIRGNASYMGGAGGGEFAFVSPGFIGCTISENESHNDHDAFGLAEGGGLAFYYSYPTLVNCTFTNNLVSAGWLTRGAALRFSGEIGNTASLYNCVFSGNSGVSPTETISAERCSLDLLTSTVTAIADAPLIVIESGVLFAWNAILVGEGDPILLGPDSSTEVSFSNVAGGWAGTGNIDADPQFVNPAGGDFRLAPGSPCIDTGSTFVPPDLTMDRDGNPRIVDGDGDGNARIDMGAYEFQPCAGDLDGNHAVGLSDLAILLSHFGAPGSAADGDLDRNGNVDLSDLALLLGVFGATCP